MQFKGMNLCDFCFQPMGPDNICNHCGLSHETYQPDAGILAPGTNLNGKYIIGKTLGRGGFGATYLAYSSDLDKVVAIKEYLPVSIAYRGKDETRVSIVSDEKKAVFEKGAKRFFEEAKTISQFNQNPNIVSVYEFFYANDTVYYSMEYLDGTDFKKYIDSKGGRLSEPDAVKIMKSICNALKDVHSAQILHRDIAPDNIFICSNGDVKLIDFGAAKEVITNEHQSYSVVVKQGFAPAEQYTRNGKQGTWTDIYALGATMYYTLLGKVPQDAIDRVENPELVFDSRINLSSTIKNVISKCMAIKITDRYQDVSEILYALDEIPVPMTFYNAGAPQQSFPNTSAAGFNNTQMQPTSQQVAPPIAYTGNAVQGNVPPQPQAPKRKSMLGLIIGCASAFIAVMVAVAFILFPNTSKPKNESGGGGGGGGGGESSHIQMGTEGCSICGSNGHLASAHCTYTVDGNQCNATDHKASDHCTVCGKVGEHCKLQKDGTCCGATDHKKEDHCTECLALGHTGADCPVVKQQQQQQQQQQKCGVCGSTTHTTANCPKNKAKCGVCGSTSHTTANCPKNKAKCGVCGSTSHTTANCPNNKPKCGVCGSTAHATANCPNKPKCGVCGSTAHATANCPNKPKCGVCGSTAHATANCPNKPKCGVCGSTAHATANCPNRQCNVCGSTSHTTSNHPRCGVCGSVAHSTSQCPNADGDL